MDRLTSIGKVLATIGGASWTVKSGAIILMNDHFQPVEGVLYFLGVGGLIVGAMGFAAFVARRWSGPVRWVGFILLTAAALTVTGLASSLVQTAVADSYTGSNVGIEEEMGILTPGVIWLTLGFYMIAATRSPVDRSRVA